MNKDSIIIILAVLLFISAYFAFVREEEFVDVPIKLDIPIPVVEVQFDTIKDPYPVYVPGPKVID